MNRIIMRLIISLLIILGILFIGPLLDAIKENKVMAIGKNRFAFFSSEVNFNIYYDKKTKVMYAVSDCPYNRGNVFLLVDAEGKPLLYEGEK